MGERMPALRELGDLLGCISHPVRLRIIEELGQQECDVNSLQQMLEIPHSAVSQHLALLRAHRVVVERRDGRRVIYRLRNGNLARWVFEGFALLESDPVEDERLRLALERARETWRPPPARRGGGGKKRGPRSGSRVGV